MSQLKILRQDVITSFQHNITEENIDAITQEIIRNTKLDIKIELSIDNYMCYGSNIIIPHMLQKISGFGRTEYEAIRTSLINLVDQLLLEERYFNPIRDSIKVFIANDGSKSKAKNKKSNNTSSPSYQVIQTDNRNSIIDTNDNHVDTKLASQSITIPVLDREISFELLGTQLSFKEIIKEKDLILKEMHNLIMDIMSYSKIIEYFEQDTNAENIPKYYKCPISWQLMDNPVVSTEGHSYEKWAINKWLTMQKKSPITGLEFDDVKMVQNYTLKYAIDDFCFRQVKMKKMKIELQKFLMKCEYDLTDLRKYLPTPNLYC